MKRSERARPGKMKTLNRGSVTRDFARDKLSLPLARAAEIV